MTRSKKWWVAKAVVEPDGPCTVGAPDERDALWECQQLAALGIEQTNDTGPLAEIFAAIHRCAASALCGAAEMENAANQVRA